MAEPDSTQSAKTRKTLAWVILVLGFGFIPLTVFRMLRAIATENIDPTAEIWTAIAYDWHTGVAYRPLFSALGYGGTRYFPGHVVLQSAAMHLASPLRAGFLVTAFALILLLASSYGILRQYGIKPLLSAAGACLTLYALTVQEAAVQTKGDLLPVALSLCGLFVTALAAKSPGSEKKIALAGLFFGYAWFTKWTSVAAPAAAVWLLWFGARRKSAGILIVTTALTALVLVSYVQYKSEGRFIDILRVCATARSRSKDMLLMPLHVFQSARTLFRISIAAPFLAVAVLAERSMWTTYRMLVVYGAAALLAALSVYSGQGAERNHLLEVETISMLLVAASLAHGKLHRQSASIVLASLLLCFANLMASPELGLAIKEPRPRSAGYAESLKRLATVSGPILSEYPLLPIKLKQRPFLLDGWMFAPIEAKRPGLAADLKKRLARKEFGALVLSFSPETPSGRVDIDYWFTQGMGDAIHENYTQVESTGSYVVLIPRS